jgi:uncharacterized membrane protein YfhO
LQQIGLPDFDPRHVAYSETQTPKLSQDADGEAKITQESPRHVTIDFDMKTPGVVVLSDTWDPGWRATVDGAPAEVLRANYNFRGVAVPAGKGTIQFDYQPASFYRGLELAALAGVTLLSWSAFLLWPTVKPKRLTTDSVDGHG